MVMRCKDRPRERRGRNQCCRGVTNPAGIDLSRRVAQELGLGPRENAWVIVITERLP